tara:strand:+ start:2353 stop:3021 length:669 start_codon:yes stop_codon:yes gene_type:complete
MTEVPDQIDVADMADSFREERVQEMEAPALELKSAPMRGVSPVNGDDVADSYSSGTGGPGGALNVEYRYGEPGKEMKARKRMAAQANVQADGVVAGLEDRGIRGSWQDPEPAPNFQPQKQNWTNGYIVDSLYEMGIGYLKFFVSPNLPAGVQWLFPSRSVLMINKDDFADVQVKLAKRVSELTGFKGDGFVGDATELFDDPTLGPLMAMGGMFHVEHKEVDE